MKDRHLTAEVLEALRRGELSEEEKELLGHVSACEVCRAFAESRGHPISTLLETPGKSIPRRAYSRVLERVFESVVSESQRLEGQRAAAPQLLKELLALGPSQRQLLIRNSSRYRDWAVAEELLESSRRGWSNDPKRSEELAQLALEIAGTIDVFGLRGRLCHDLRAEAWSYIGNSRRIQSDLISADAAFQSAEHELAQGSGDPLERARLQDLKASLRAAQRRYKDAAALLSEAIAVYRSAGDRHLEGRGLLKQAKFLCDSGHVEECIPVTQRAAELVDLVAEPELAFLLKRNLILYLFEVGRLQEAQDLLPEVRVLARRHGTRLERLRLLWTEGLLRQKIGQPELAEETLGQVRKGFIGAGIGYDVALVSLDLAALYLEAGRTHEVRALAAETAPVFVSLQVQRELLVAWQLFKEAAEQDVATLRLIKEVAARIRENQGSRAS